MAKAPDLNKMMQDAASAFQFDTGRLNDAFRSTAGYGEKFSKLALDAAGASTELSAKWTRDTLSKLGEVSKAKEGPQEYGQALTDFAQSQAALMNEQMAAFAEIAKRVQTETVELMMQAAKEISDEAQTAVKTASEKVQKAAPK